MNRYRRPSFCHDIGLIFTRIALFTEAISFISHPERKGLDPRIVPIVLGLLLVAMIFWACGWAADRQEQKAASLTPALGEGPGRDGN